MTSKLHRYRESGFRILRRLGDRMRVSDLAKAQAPRGCYYPSIEALATEQPRGAAIRAAGEQARARESPFSRTRHHHGHERFGEGFRLEGL